MDNQIETLRSKEFFHRRPVADIQRRVCESLRHTLEPLQIPQRVARRTEEHPAHVVVHADDFVPLAVEMLGSFRTNQSAAARDQNFHAFESNPHLVGPKPWKSGAISHIAFLK